MKYILIFFTIIVSIGLYTATLKGKAGNFSHIEELSKESVSGTAFESSHERATYATTLTLLKEKSFALPKPLADFSTPDVGYYKGKFYSYFPPGISVLIAPFYSLGEEYNLGQLAAYAVMPIFAIGSLIMIIVICMHVFKTPLWAALFSAFTFGFATTSWNYSITIYQHIVQVFIMLTCFYLVWLYKKKIGPQILWGVLFWLLVGISPFFDYPNPILLFPLMVYFLISSIEIKSSEKNYRFSINLALFITPIMLVAMIILHGYYNQKVFGSYRRLSNNLPRYEIKNLQKLVKNETSFVSNKETAKLLRTFQEDRIIFGGSELMYADDKGFLFYSPILAIGIIGMLAVAGQLTIELSILIALFVINLFLYASFSDPWGGWAYGPRYLIPSMAVLSIFGGLWISNKPRIYKRFIALVFIIYSSAISVLGALTTNQVPPKVEGVYLKIKYNFLLNWDYLLQDRSSSYVYNTYFSQNNSLFHYSLALYAVIMVMFVLILFLFPYLVKDENKSKH